MKLRKQDQEFRNPKVFYADPKNIDLDRVLITLFLFLKSEGTRHATRGRQQPAFERVEKHLNDLRAMPGVTGFDKHPEIAHAWLKTDIFDLVNRGRPTEAIASLRPLHLEAHKVRVAKNCRDYNHADALYAMLANGERQAISDLRDYLQLGRDNATKKYDGKTDLDIETLAVLKLVEDIPDIHGTGDPVAPNAPTCSGQSRLLCDDVQRILAYRHEVPRPVMIDYLKTILGLHLGLLTLRVGRQLSGWVRDQKAHEKCRSCPVAGHLDEPFKECPYEVSLTVDMGSDYRSRMAQLAQESAASEHDRFVDLVRAVFAMNQLLRYAREERLKDDPLEVPSILADPPASFEADFKATLKQILSQKSDDEELPQEINAIVNAGLPSFDALIELVTHVRQRHHVSYLVQMVDKLFQKNSPFGALVQGRSLSNPRRWHLGGRLLEVFVQLAVLRFEENSSGQKIFRTEPVLLDDFVRWIERRYGFVIAPGTTPGARRPVTLDEHRAFRDNVRSMKDRLREIGFFDDLSDAYNAQTVRPRYHLTGKEHT